MIEEKQECLKNERGVLMGELAEGEGNEIKMKKKLHRAAANLG